MSDLNNSTKINNTKNNQEENKMNNLNSNTTTNTEVNTMNFFADIGVPVQERKNAIEWTLDDCKNNLKVIFKKCSDADSFNVSINLGGLTSLKVFKGETTFKMKKGLMEEEEILARVVDADSVIEEARGRMIQSLRKAKQSREATKAKKERALVSFNKEQMNKLSKLHTKTMNKLKKEELQDKIDLASLMSEAEEIESNQALTQLLSK
jgi:hypothetical protein